MGRIAEVNTATLLLLKTYDGNTSRGVQARVYNDAGTEQSGSPFTLTHAARGNYKSTSWTPTVQGTYYVNYEVYTDGTFASLDVNYTQLTELVFVRSSASALRDGTAQAGSTTTITLDASASSVDNYYRGAVVQILSGAGAGQSRTIFSYVGSTKVATMDLPWATAPDNTSLFTVKPAGSALLSSLESSSQHFGTAQSGAAGTITLASTASATNQLYRGATIKIYSGTGAGQSRSITDYNGTTKVATVARNWAINPDSTSVYSVLAIVTAKINDSLEVTVGTNNDKTGYSLAAASILASTFAANAIDANALASDASDEIAAKILITPANKLLTNASGYVTLADGSIMAAKFATDAIDANALAGSAADEIAAKILLTPANLLTTDSSGHVTLADGSLVAAKFATDAITATALAASAVNEIAAAILLTPANKLFTDASGFVTLVDASLSAAKFATDAIDANALAGSAADEIAAKILATPANLLVTDASGFVTLSNASITAAKFAANAIDANALAGSAADEIAAKILLNPANLLDTDASGFVTLSDGSLTAAKFAVDSITASAIAAGAIDASALATDAVTEIVDAIFGKVIDTKTFEEISEILLAYSTGKIERTGSTYVYKKQDNTTTLFTLVSSPTDRTRL